MSKTETVWSCTIGSDKAFNLPSGADSPMRKAVEEAFYELTGEHAEFNFSGWGDKLRKSERQVVDEWKKRDNEGNGNG